MNSEKFIIQKESFIKSSKENILNFYDFHPKELGRGAYGVVYKGKAKGKNNNEPWRAIKKIPKKDIKNPQMLRNEIQILRSIDHPTIIKLYQTFEDEQNVFLVLDFCDGGQLFDRLELQGNFSENNAREIFKQIIEALSYCHHNKISHRDLKPENFLFLSSQSMNLKLIDFGLSFKWQHNMQKQLQQKKQKKLVGTSYYIAPEVIQSKYDERCDIWSAGVILYILVTAVPPFDGDNDKQILEMVKKYEYSFNIPQMQSISLALQDLIRHILQPSDKRYTLKQIFEHPWMKLQIPKQPLKLNFNKMINFSKYSKLKKFAATYIASQLSQKEVQKLGLLFKQLDLNHDGQISIDELKIALKSNKNQSTNQQLNNLMKIIDTGQNGKINYNEFLASNADNQTIFTENHIKKVFQMLDQDGNGMVSKEELVKMLQRNGMNQFNGKNAQEIIASCDKDGNGMIDYAEFKASIQS